jgi:hypothetical protein
MAQWLEYVRSLPTSLLLDVITGGGENNDSEISGLELRESGGAGLHSSYS